MNAGIHTWQAVRWWMIVALAAAGALSSCGGARRDTSQGPPARQPSNSSAVMAERLGLEEDDRLEGRRPTPPPESDRTAGRYPPSDLKVAFMDGQRAYLEAYQGHPLLVIFFTTDNLDCQHLLMQFEILFQRYKENGLRIAAVSLDLQGRKFVEPYVETLRLTYDVYLADGDLRRGVTPFGNLSMIPTTMLFDPAGRLKKSYLGLMKVTELERDVLDTSGPAPAPSGQPETGKEVK